MAQNERHAALTHFQRLELSTVHRLIYFLHQKQVGIENPLDVVFDLYPFLIGAFNALRPILPEDITWEESFVLLQETLNKWEWEIKTFLPIRAFRESANLDHLALQAMMLIGMVEDSRYFAMLFKSLQKPGDNRRPTVQLITDILDTHRQKITIPFIESLGKLLNSGLVEVLNPSAPRAEWQLRIPPVIWDLLKGSVVPQLPDYFTWHPAHAFPAIEDLLLKPTEKERLAKIPQLLQSGQATAFVLRGLVGSERLEVVGSVARAAGANLLAAEDTFTAHDDRWQLLGPMATLTQSMPVFSMELAPGETFDIPRLVSYRGAVLVVLGESGGLKGDCMKRAVSFSMDLPSSDQRQSHWHIALRGYKTDKVEEIAERFLLPGEYIRQAAHLAINQAHLENTSQINVDHVRQATQMLNRQRLESLAQRMEGAVGWDHLIVNSKTEASLKELTRRCRFREKLGAHLGTAFSCNINRGVRALFNGPSGTGKSLAARILATELGLDLYKIDLSAVVNKYIGETEKNLHIIFSRAEELDIILLLDEGDALLSNRTQVKSANDRYANLETNYLLQRLETYNGILFITSNLSENIDPAFQRRIDVQVEFPYPAAEERWQIWQLHLPVEHEISENVLFEVASRCKLSGGQIRNAAIYASCLALDEGHRLINDHHLALTIENEYRKAGGVSPLSAARDIFVSGEERLSGMVSVIG